LAEKSKQQLVASGRYTKPIVTLILPTTTFWPAENFHQQFYKKNPSKYKKIERARQQLMTYQKLESKIKNDFNPFSKKS
ncbi:peptide-methionine (S)-S-oxide reductase, partial [Carnobacterium sp.]|uniref:peptide-methionine (S)-S-oxide reductase n=1 Tax=Carnobacterium sp. TaxID=48221 RepID=UPI003C70E934